MRANVFMGHIHHRIFFLLPQITGVSLAPRWGVRLEPMNPTSGYGYVLLLVTGPSPRVRINMLVRNFYPMQIRLYENARSGL